LFALGLNGGVLNGACSCSKPLYELCLVALFVCTLSLTSSVLYHFVTQMFFSEAWSGFKSVLTYPFRYVSRVATRAERSRHQHDATSTLVLVDAYGRPVEQ
jgi:hypothetical protein